MGYVCAELRLLGPFSLTVGGTGNSTDRPIGISSRKARALLAYLAMSPGEDVDRELLADLLWGDSADGDARHNLRQCIVTLRKILDTVHLPLLLVKRNSLALKADATSVDALGFAVAAHAGDTTVALALHRGEFLANLNLDSEAFKDWVRMERNRFATLAASVFERAATERDAARDGKNAIAAAQHLIAVDPLREDWQRLLLQFYARYTGRNRAIVHARQLFTLLKRDLDVEPEPATLALFESIRDGLFHSVVPSGEPAVIA
jgi:DNA-binding SARP family transcriptional activator